MIREMFPLLMLAALAVPASLGVFVCEQVTL